MRTGKRAVAVIGTLVLTALLSSTTPPDLTADATTNVRPTKLLTFIEENHSYAQMRNQMPYLFGLAQTYGYATNWTAIRYPSLPNYLAIAGGSTFGVTNDDIPTTNAKKVGPAESVFDEAIAAGRTAKVYAESMRTTCQVTSAPPYAVKHNPWAYFSSYRNNCKLFDVSTGSLLADASANRLPNAGMVIPNLCHDAHDCSLATADNWLSRYLPTVLASSDFTTGKLEVVVTADTDDRSSGNKVLTVVMHEGMHGVVVTSHLTHFSLTRAYAQVLGVRALLNGATAPDMQSAFGLG